jgi:hypothetical protein
MADLGRFAQLLEKLSTSVEVVKKQLRRVSTAGSSYPKEIND